jgi:hypothetical protein
MTGEGIADLAAHCAGDLETGPFVQHRDELAGSPLTIAEAHTLLDSLLDGWIGRGDV